MNMGVWYESNVNECTQNSFEGYCLNPIDEALATAYIDKLHTNLIFHWKLIPHVHQTSLDL